MNNLNDAKDFLKDNSISDPTLYCHKSDLERFLSDFADQQRAKWNKELIEQLDLVRPNVTVRSLKEAVKEWVK